MPGWRAGRPGDEVRSEEAQGLSKCLQGPGSNRKQLNLQQKTRMWDVSPLKYKTWPEPNYKTSFGKSLGCQSAAAGWRCCRAQAVRTGTRSKPCAGHVRPISTADGRFRKKLKVVTVVLQAGMDVLFLEAWDIMASCASETVALARLPEATWKSKRNLSERQAVCHYNHLQRQ